MSRRRQSRSRGRVDLAPLLDPAEPAAAGLPTPQAMAYMPGGPLSGGGHQGADNNRNRGMVYWPQLDTRREISSYTRTEILRKGRWLYANHGIAKRIVNGLSRMVAGTGLTVQASTDDREWNALAEKAFAQRANSPFAFDIGARYDFAASQQAQLRFSYRDGDASAILTKSQAGGGRLAFYEGHQIGNGSTTAGLAGWRDGVRTDAANRAQAYRYLGDDGKSTDVAAQDVMFFCDYERAGQSRGLSILSGAINHLLDSTEALGYIKTGVKLANRFAYWIEKGSPASSSSGGVGDRVGGNTYKVSTDNGPVTFERIYGAGAIPDLKPGESLKFNGSTHPHPNNLNFIDYLIRDVAWGCGISPEILWNIAALGGANTRFVLADAQGWIEEQQQKLVRLYCARVWVYFIALEMKAGRLRPCRDPEWWKHAWIPPPRLTVDFGRDGKLHLEQLKMGVITYTRLLGWQGQDFETHTDKWLDEIAYMKRGLAARDLTWGDVQNWRNINAQPNAADNLEAAVADLADATSPGDAESALAGLIKNPNRAAAVLDHLRRQPESA